MWNGDMYSNNRDGKMGRGVAFLIKEDIDWEEKKCIMIEMGRVMQSK